MFVRKHDNTILLPATFRCFIFSKSNGCFYPLYYKALLLSFWIITKKNPLYTNNDFEDKLKDIMCKYTEKQFFKLTDD